MHTGDDLLESGRRGPCDHRRASRRLLAGESPVTVWREEQDLSQRALAEAVGVAPSLIHAIEKGTKSPGLDTARRVAGVRRVGLDDLFGAPS